VGISVDASFSTKEGLESFGMCEADVGLDGIEGVVVSGSGGPFGWKDMLEVIIGSHDEIVLISLLALGFVAKVVIVSVPFEILASTSGHVVAVSEGASFWSSADDVTVLIGCLSQ
jgi:hypothetical protein